MTKLVLDRDLSERLRASTESVELVDEEGQFVGLFRPASQPYFDAALVPPISEADWKHLASQPGKYTTAEVLQFLENLPCTP